MLESLSSQNDNELPEFLRTDAGPMTETVLMGNLAIRSYMLRKPNNKGRLDFYARKKLLWDGDNIKITNLDEANQFVGREYRKGWEI